MRRRQACRKAEELLSRTVEVQSVRPYVSVHAMGGGRGEEPRIECGSWLQVHGYLDSTVKDVFDITIHVHSEEPLRVGSVRPVAARPGGRTLSGALWGPTGATSGQTAATATT